MADTTIRGSTTIEALVERFPDGRALALMSDLGWPCAYCSARSSEPLSLAAKRHGNPVAAVVACFRALETSDNGKPDEQDLAHAMTREKPGKDAMDTWRRAARN